MQLGVQMGVAVAATTFLVTAGGSAADPDNARAWFSVGAIAGLGVLALGVFGGHLPFLSSKATAWTGVAAAAAAGYGALIGHQFGTGDFRPPPQEILM